MAANQTFDKITLDLDVKHGAWNANGSNENHAIFWLNRGDKWAQNVYGYVNVFGPTSKNESSRK